MASSLARPPALRITCASPSAKPAYLAGSSRASMQVRMAKRRDGGRASLSLSPKLAAYARLDASTSERIWLIWNPPVDQLWPTAHQQRCGLQTRFLKQYTI